MKEKNVNKYQESTPIKRFVEGNQIEEKSLISKIEKKNQI